jgi:hypothetical protein
MDDALKGIGLAEDAQLLGDAINSGSWSEGLAGGFGAGIDALGFVANPAHALLSAGVAWLMEHVSILTDALDQFAGDPGAIQAYAQQWRDQGSSILDSSIDLRNAVNVDTAAWAGASANGYREQAGVQVDGVQAAALVATSVGDAVSAAGEIVGTVRLLVRDLIADCVAEIISRLPVWLALSGVSLGLGTPAVIADAVALIAKWV